MDVPARSAFLFEAQEAGPRRIRLLESLFLAQFALGLWLAYIARAGWPSVAYFFLMAGLCSVLPLRKYRLPFFVFGVLWAFAFISGRIPYAGGWPLGMYATGAFGWLVLMPFDNHRYRGYWTWSWSRTEWVSFFGILVPTVLILLIYYHFHSEIARAFPMPRMPGWVIPIAVTLIALINGLGEEFAYRFVLQKYLMRDCRAQVAIVAQALAFGLLHYKGGFPAGYVGVVLTFFFGIAMGIQYHLHRSITLNWATHSAADLIMFTIILMTRGGTI